MSTAVDSAGLMVMFSRVGSPDGRWTINGLRFSEFVYETMSA